MTLVLSVAAVSQSFADTPWTYADCVEYARSHNITLRKLKLNETTAAYDVEEAKAQWQPTLDFGTSHTYSNSVWGNGDHNTLGGNFNLNAGWTVYNGGVRSNTIKLNQKQQEIETLATDDAFRTIETDLLAVYLNLLYAEESIAIYEETVQLSEAQSDRARQLMEGGKLSRVDYAQLKAQLEQDKYNLANARSQYATRRMELKKMLQLGLSDSIVLAAVEWPDAEIVAGLPPIDESYALALQTDLQLQSLALKADAADLSVAIAKAGHAPRIELNAGVGTSYMVPTDNFGKELRNSFGEQVGITLSLPIFDQKKTKVAVAKANVDKLDVELDSELRRLELSQAVESWYVDVAEAQSRYTAALQQEESAALSDELVNERFNVGLVNPVELLTSHNNLLEARHAVLQAKYLAVLGRKMIEFYRTASISMP